MKPLENDKRLLSLDYIGEAADILAALAAGICAAAGAGNMPALESAIRAARGNILEIIAEFKTISKDGGAGNE